MGTTLPKLHRLGKPVSPDCYGIAETMLGPILFVWQDDFLVRLHIIPAHSEEHAGDLLLDWGWDATIRRDDARAETARRAVFLKKHWTGIFSDTLRLGFYGTDFQWDAMNAMLKIPAGKTVTYAALAQKSGNQGAARAAGTVCAKNPLPLIVPCHRILASDGGLGGYGYGTALKRQLLDWERESR